MVAKSLNLIVWYMESATVAKEHHREVGSLIISKAGDYGVRSHPEPVRPGGERHAELESMIVQPRFHRFGLAVRHCYIRFLRSLETVSSSTRLSTQNGKRIWFLTSAPL